MQCADPVERSLKLWSDEDEAIQTSKEHGMMAQLAASNRTLSDRVREPLDAHVALLTNFVPPYQLPVFEKLAQRVRKLSVLISTPMEKNRSWNADWGTLDVAVQRTITWHRRWRFEGGAFSEIGFVHVPWDTIFRLSSLAPDVIISAELGPRSILSTCYKAFAKRTRLVFALGLSEHTESERGRARTFVRRRLLPYGESVLVNGRSGARYLQALGVEPSRIFRTPYTASPVFFEEGSDHRPAEIARRLFYPGRLIESKGLLPFLRVLRKWGEAHPHRAVDFDIVGEGALSTAIAEFRVPPNVRVHLSGKVEYHQLPAEYRARGILVIPTLYDEWALVVNEALASGMPVLGSRYSQAVQDLCVDGVNGWTFRPDIGHEMEQALDAALTASDGQLNLMRRAARDSISGVTADATAQTICEAVEHALNAPRRRRP
jgi:glycosyltransferase involved in cell wall biosynthesis